MRQIIVKYNGECTRCGNILEVGNPAMYEKSMGIFCMGCEPNEVEDIREFRQAKASRKADRYDGWAKKREDQAEKDLNSHPEQRQEFLDNLMASNAKMRNVIERFFQVYGIDRPGVEELIESIKPEFVMVTGTKPLRDDEPAYSVELIDGEVVVREVPAYFDKQERRAR